MAQPHSTLTISWPLAFQIDIWFIYPYRIRLEPRPRSSFSFSLPFPLRHNETLITSKLLQLARKVPSRWKRKGRSSIIFLLLWQSISIFFKKNIQQGFLTSMHNKTAFGTDISNALSLKSWTNNHLKINEINSSLFDKFIVILTMFLHHTRERWRFSMKMRLRLSNFCGETRDDAAAELKSSSFNDDLLASLLPLVCIISVSANKVLTGCRSNSIPVSRMRF